MRARGCAPLGRLHELVSAQGGSLADALLDQSPGETGEVFASLVAGGKPVADAEEYALVIESIHEGYLLHYERARLLSLPDPDMRLLAGDYFYALGLARLAAIGDLEAVAQLADLIALCAQAHATSSSRRIAGALWALAVLAVVAGGWPEQERAKQLARTDGARALEEMLSVARTRAKDIGLGMELEQALIAFTENLEERPSRT